MNASGGPPGKAYSLEEFGISEAELSQRLAGILERFGYRPEDVPEKETREML